MKCFVVLLVCISIGWVHSCKIRQEEISLIKGATATQSSTYRPDYAAEKAIDGISDYNMMRHPCAQTRREHSPWWQLDLKYNYRVDSVVIVNRRDCCFHTLLGAQIRIGNSPDNNNPVCGIITDVFRPINLCCNGMEGRYVSVVIPGREEELTLCEVKVYGEDNIARLGEATQSSTYRPEYNAVTAIDGDRNPDMMAGSCSLTGNDNPAWWQLDLKKRYKVGRVVILNREDCCSERLLGAEVRVGDSSDNNNPVCGTVTNLSKETITVSCHGKEGQYVSVVIPGREEYLQLCEVEVYEQE
ncbi:novel protein similar to fucolectin precursor [Xenopus tropicalis]|uniref:Novel protein similar to fucolectin n=1 Tax=Xenopus tropicalis TaxID=8364 RepID=Q28IN6_XENTR|nr:novel protein similar to fucolectin precursor [Xenopus tropicalis]CAJ82872.1 novel protein similar to fucolectin [Xenopus tropicalis]|eukprot:NP_001037891.1 novel protein similar to fucolectin precursor [Xenopus tropicalis]